MGKITDNKKRIMAGNISIIAAIVILTFGCWNEYSWYEQIAPLGTLVSAVFLVITLFCYVDIKVMLRDRDFYLVGACNLLALIHLIIIKSNMGAILTVACLSLMLYLCDKIRIPKKILYAVSAYMAFYFYYWTIDVKGYFKGYNTNYGGLVLITGFVFAIVLLVAVIEYLKNAVKGEEKLSAHTDKTDKGIKNLKIKKILLVLVSLFFVFMFAWGYNIIAWYRARCALIGLITVIFIMLFPQKLLAKKWIYGAMVFLSTIGAILVSLLYVWLGSMKDTFTLKIFYKDIISGREEVWSELWGVYVKKPITGIGSAYTMKLEWMGGMFEVHNGLLDILIVHGFVVFTICAYLLIKKLWKTRKIVASSKVAKAAVAGIVTMLVSSFFENFFIVPPFTVCMILLFAWIFTIGEQNDIIL